MPFTLAHPAAILPLHRFWRDGFLALVVGSIGPDIPYFLPERWFRLGASTHSARGALLVGAPLALALLVLLVLLRPVLVAPLWEPHRALVNNALGRFLARPVLWLHAVPAVIVGALTHFACDSFTHRYGWFVGHVAPLAELVALPGGHELPVYLVLQYLTSVAGLVLLLAWYRHRLAGAAIAGEAAGWRPYALLGLLITAAAVGARAAERAPARYHSVHGAAFLSLTTAIDVFAGLYVLLGALLLIASALRPAKAPAGGVAR